MGFSLIEHKHVQVHICPILRISTHIPTGKYAFLLYSFHMKTVRRLAVSFFIEVSLVPPPYIRLSKRMQASWGEAANACFPARLLSAGTGIPEIMEHASVGRHTWDYQERGLKRRSAEAKRGQKILESKKSDSSPPLISLHCPIWYCDV